MFKIQPESTWPICTEPNITYLKWNYLNFFINLVLYIKKNVLQKKRCVFFSVFFFYSFVMKTSIDGWFTFKGEKAYHFSIYIDLRLREWAHKWKVQKFIRSTVCLLNTMVHTNTHIHTHTHTYFVLWQYTIHLWLPIKTCWRPLLYDWLDDSSTVRHICPSHFYLPFLCTLCFTIPSTTQINQPKRRITQTEQKKRRRSNQFIYTLPILLLFTFRLNCLIWIVRQFNTKFICK